MSAYGLPSSLDPRTLRGRVTLILNGTMVVLLGLFLFIDFQRDFADRLRFKRTALDEQARLLEPGILERLAKGSDSVQEFLRASVSRMEDVDHGKHWIAVYAAKEWLRTDIEDRDSIDVDTTLQAVSNGEQNLPEAFAGQFVIGQNSGSKVTILIAETYQEVRSAIWSDLRRHLLGVGLILLVGIVTLNFVMHAGFLTPLTHFAVAARTIGKGKFGSQIDAVGIRELDDLRSAFNEMSAKLADAERNRTTQMHTARLIQEHLLPKSPVVEGFQVSYLFKPTEAIGGDYFDVLPLQNGGSIVAVADASGHGVPAALVAAIVKVLLLDAVDHTSDPAEILKFIDKRLTGLEIPEAFVTMLLVRLMPGGDHLDYASAGHISGWVIATELRRQALPSTGPLLGAGLDFGWQTERIGFPSGSRLALPTDGIVEASLPDGDIFGEVRLCDALTQTLAMDPSDSLTAVYNQLQQHMQGQECLDDVTLLLVDPAGQSSLPPGPPL